MKIFYITIFIFLSLSAPYRANAAIIKYNFSGQLSMISDPNSLLETNRKFNIGDHFQAIYTLETDTQHASGAFGVGPFTNSYYTNAILNFKFYVGIVNLVDSSYRTQSFHNVNGMINGKPADWIAIETDGGLDNYNNEYGKNVYNEYIDSELSIYDLSGTALDQYNKIPTGNIPLTINLDDFTFGNIRILGEPTRNIFAGNYQIRGEIKSFSNNDYQPVPEPKTLILFFFGLLSLIAYRKYNKREQ